jgi:pyruvate dehydrogenase E2 component (dihydrolipoamide acetyltransferase)
MDHAGPAASGGLAASRGAFPGPTKEIPVQGIRRRVAERMLASLQTTAQVTLFMSADATAIRSYRARLKASRPDLSSVNVNDMILYAVSRTLLAYPEMNAYFERSKILQFERVHLGFAVDTPRGLMVPVIRHADQLSLREISMEAKRLAASCVEGKISSGELSGGTFTVSNLGTVGIEYFTPVLYSPQVGIVGVGNITLRPVEADGKYEFVPHLPLSLTVDHQAVDGAPAARFLQSLAANLATFDLLLAE